MRAQHDRAARLQGNQDLIDGRRSGIRRRHDGGDDAERLGNLDDAFLVVACDDADGLHRTDEAEDLLRREQILLDLVSHDPVAGLVDGQLGKGTRLIGRRGRHGVDDGVDAFLGELGELEPRLLRAPCESACFGDRGEIAVRVRGGCFCHH